MIVLGVDPGIAITGYGLVEECNGTLKPVDYGVVTTSSNMRMSDRLIKIYDSINQIISYYNPDALAVEELFFNKNVKTALIVGHARGVAILAAAKKGIPIYEYTPLQVKQAVVGYGRAEKNQVQQMIKFLLRLREIPKPDDAADALAVSVCHIHCAEMGRKFGLR